MTRLLNGKALFLVILATIAMLVLAACAGQDGATGNRGPAGPAGPAGVDGGTGAAGSQGRAGPAGAEGAKGATGAMGTVGRQGPSLNSSVSLSPSSVNEGPLSTTVYGSGFANGERVVVTLWWPDGSKTSLGSTDGDAGGLIVLKVGTADALTTGNYGIVAIGNSGSSASTPLLVGIK